jgi:hypothetical protein
MDWAALQKNLAPAFSNGFGEDVLYTPTGGTPRTIKAHVDRNPPEHIAPDGQVLTPKMRITVNNDATTGISSATVDRYGSDTITVAYRIGTAPTAFPLYQVPPGTPLKMAANDAGRITFDLR